MNRKTLLALALVALNAGMGAARADEAALAEKPLVLLAKDKKTKDIIGIQCAADSVEEGAACEQFRFVLAREGRDADGEKAIEVVNEDLFPGRVYSPEQLQSAGRIIQSWQKVQFGPPIFIPTAIVIVKSVTGNDRLAPLLLLTIPFDLVTAAPILAVYTPGWAVAKAVKEGKLHKIDRALTGEQLRRVPRFTHKNFENILYALEVAHEK